MCRTRRARVATGGEKLYGDEVGGLIKSGNEVLIIIVTNFKA